MKTHARVLAAGAVLALGIGILATADLSAADDKDARDVVRQIADMIEKKNDAGAKKLAEQAAKDLELHDAMSVFALKSKKGFGFGSKPGAATPDGIEAQLIGLSRKAKMQKEVDAIAADLARAGYVAAAVAEIALKNVPDKDEGMKKKADWVKWTQDMRTAGVKLAEAGKAKNANDVKTAATALNSSCNNCHGVIRD
jgi:hypothetical protein